MEYIEHLDQCLVHNKHLIDDRCYYSGKEYELEGLLLAGPNLTLKVTRKEEKY